MLQSILTYLLKWISTDPQTVASHPSMVGLTLAQALQKQQIPFEIYERDSAADDPD
ncbi:uncharacterized protein BO72DRAFT_502504 [Aspergillus fijiensis CBS 313.89]|uniref:Uncharacterized protein n=1 Tax=Aspergillus fijiensis CBS 313.89 TaxID=1448319 RepID=A0A8G1RED0_9EURO|nr:uncharacterized protein BO72DRAFT_502504 [Aspergillus fijiensis CBS 313.89]RAK70797.1 hypothetical protein BO72DRAFT_502504 [Aspergillus fijiensis CBS 313.89]